MNGLLILAFIVALFVGWLTARSRRVRIVDTLSTVALIGLVAARVVFVIHYFPLYSGSIVGMLDIRDGGFSAVGGLAAAALYVAWLAWRRPRKRAPLFYAAGAGALVWGLASGAILLMNAQVQQPPNATLATLDGRSVQLDTLAHKHPGPVVVNFWASWCPPCRKEMPVLARAQQQRPGIQFVFVNQGENENTVRQFLDSQGLELSHVLLDPSHEIRQRVLPTTYFYDSSGEMIYLHHGMLSRATLAHELERFNPRSIPSGTREKPREKQ